MTKLSLLKTRRRHGTRDTRTRSCHHGNVRGSYSSTPVHHSATMGDKQPRCRSATGGEFEFLERIDFFIASVGRGGCRGDGWESVGDGGCGGDVANVWLTALEARVSVSDLGLDSEQLQFHCHHRLAL